MKLILLSAIALAAALSVLPAPVMAEGRSCPPGLAKKAVPCVPPGHAKAWIEGQRLPADIVWRNIDDWQRYGLPRPGDGQAYIRVDDEVLLLGLATRMVLRNFGVLN